MTLAEWEIEIESEVLTELECQNPIRKRFVYVNFLSRSAGRGRVRRRREVTLVADLWEPWTPPRYRTWDRFPFDTKATDVYEHENHDGLEADSRLRHEIPKHAQRK